MNSSQTINSFFAQKISQPIRHIKLPEAPFMGSLFLNIFDPGSLDINLIRQGGKTKNGPCSSIVPVFPEKQASASINGGIVLAQASLHVEDSFACRILRKALYMMSREVIRKGQRLSKN